MAVAEEGRTIFSDRAPAASMDPGIARRHYRQETDGIIPSATLQDRLRSRPAGGTAAQADSESRLTFQTEPMPSGLAAPRTRKPAAEPRPAIDTRPPYLWAACAGLVVFLLYLLTLAPTTAFWDASEYIATAHILGIPHPPGNPVFVIMAGAWNVLLEPFGVPVPVRINLFSALMTAGASFFWFLIVHRTLGTFTAHPWVRRIGASASVLVAATAFTVWHQSNVNEKVYTVSLLTIAAISWLIFRWRDVIAESERRGGPPARVDNILALIVFLLALSVGNHLMAFLVAPALLVLIWWVRPATFVNVRLIALCLALALLGLSAHLFLPIRADLDPVINQADPVCENLGEAVVSVVTLGRAGCEDLSASLAREQYAKPPVTERQAPFTAQILNYFQYFDWQWARSIAGTDGYLPPARLPLTLLFLGLGAYGAAQHYRRDRLSFAYIAVLFATLSLGLVVYLNFKYGFMQASALGVSQELAEVRERDYFFLISFSIWGLWVGVGLTALWLALAGSDDGRSPGRKALATAAPVMLIALVPLVLNWSYASRAGDYAARDWAYNLLQSVEPYAVLFTNGDNDTFPLWYLQEVEGIRRDVQVMVGSYLNTPWYVRQVRDLTRPCEEPGAWREDPTRIICQRDFQPDRAPAFYSENGPPPRPERSALPLDDEQIRRMTDPQLGGWIRLPQDAVFSHGPIRSVLEAGTVLSPAHQFVLTIIQEAWGDRPVYFASTTNIQRQLGLQEFTVRQGFAFKLVEAGQEADLVEMPPEFRRVPLFGGYYDLERNRRLIEEAFVYRDMQERSHWVDDATRQIPMYYGWATLALAEVERLTGNVEGSERLQARAEEWLGLAER